ncbi:hypothetical protein MmazTMA_30790 [Methanosarcina mazei]|nr:hypothetical protein MmazTMA_30790 [Methanosarcina mazei]
MNSKIRICREDTLSGQIPILSPHQDPKLEIKRANFKFWDRLIEYETIRFKNNCKTKIEKNRENL